MDPKLHGILFVFAFVLFVIATFAPAEPWPYRPRLLAAGLACFAAAFIPYPF